MPRHAAFTNHRERRPIGRMRERKIRRVCKIGKHRPPVRLGAPTPGLADSLRMRVESATVGSDATDQCDTSSVRGLA